MSDIFPIPGFTEPFSSLSHLLGAGVFAVLGGILLRRGRGSLSRLAFLGVYAFSCVFLFSMSGVYHLLDFGNAARPVLGRLDHGAIFVLIAATFTPAHGILFRGWQRWLPLLLVWLAAVVGITVKTIYFDAMSGWLGLSMYLGMGWLGAVSGVALWLRFGTAFIQPLLVGGLAYSVGALLDFWRWPILMPSVIGPHELFHVAVLVGAAYHWTFTYQFAAGAPPVQRYDSSGAPFAPETLTLSKIPN